MCRLVRRALSALVPKIRVLRRPVGGRLIDCTVVQDGNLCVEETKRYWKDNLYTQTTRSRSLRWLGRTWWTRPYYETIESAYARPLDEVLRVFRDLARRGVMPEITSQSSILESGSNLGRNLWCLASRTGCYVTGVDISVEAIALARRKFYASPKIPYNHALFFEGDVLQPWTFAGFPNQAFDVVFTRWHLIHLPRSDAKDAYLKELQRIGRTVVLIEPPLPTFAKVGTIETYSQGTYCLSWDDYTTAGFTLYEVACLRGKNVGVFVKTSVP